MLKKELKISEVKSTKLKEICLIVSQRKQPISYYLWTVNQTEVPLFYYHYSVSIHHFLERSIFPMTNAITSASPICESYWETMIIDYKTNERLELPIPSNLYIRVKASRNNPKTHFTIREGVADLSDIKRVFFSENSTELLIFAFMQPT